MTNQFLSLYHQLDQDVLACLESVYLHQGQVLVVSERHLGRLLDLRLLDFAYRRGWKPTWLGCGVVNWHKQLREALARKLRAPKPRPEENGEWPGPPCEDFRELLFTGIYCWCGRLRSDHPGEAVRTAIQLLAYHERTRGLAPPRLRITGRSFDNLSCELPSDLRTFLQILPTQGFTMHDLYRLLQGKVRFVAVQASLNFLAELDLVYLNESTLLWHPSWDGAGLKNWLQEQFVRDALKEPMQPIRPGENGEASSVEACDDFRPILSKGGRICWCGHPFYRHPR